MRLDKFLANMGVGTRTEVKGYIKQGRVLVNGERAKGPEQKVDENKDEITFEGEIVGYDKYVYLMLNKPQGVVTATEDAHDKTVMDLILHPRKKQLFPVGRLDKDTEGLLLLTDDGALAHELLSPKKHVSKIYFAEIAGKVTKEDVVAFEAGLDLGDFVAQPAKLTILKSEEQSEILVEIIEGKFHQVKRMFEAVGKKVTYLKRMSMGELKLDEELELGTFRELTEQEIAILKNKNS